MHREDPPLRLLQMRGGLFTPQRRAVLTGLPGRHVAEKGFARLDQDVEGTRRWGDIWLGQQAVNTK
jgi:hypothetical protein